MKLIDKLMADFDARPVFDIDVPGWGDKGAPLKVYFKEPSLAIIKKIRADAKGDEIEMGARIVALCALDAQGNKLFDATDYMHLMRRASGAGVNVISTAIMEKVTPDMPGAEKNSEAIPED